MTKKKLNKIRQAVEIEYEKIGEPDISRVGLNPIKNIIETVENKYNFGAGLTIMRMVKELSKKKHPDRTDWDKIDMRLCPVNDWVDFYYPDGTLICRTNNDIEFLYIRTRIKEMGSVGFYLIFRNEKIEIDKNGNPKDYPDEMFTNFTDLIMKLV